MAVIVERWLVALARRIAARYGWTLVRPTPLGLLPSRVGALERRVAASGHLAHRYHVRAGLDRDVAEILNQVERLTA